MQRQIKNRGEDTEWPSFNLNNLKPPSVRNYDQKWNEAKDKLDQKMFERMKNGVRDSKESVGRKKHPAHSSADY